MKTPPILATLTLALLSLPASGEWKADHGSAAPVTVYADFQNPPSNVALDHIKSELASIMGPIGVDFEWRSLERARGNEVAVELVVVGFKGRCDMESVSSVPSGGGPLGWTHMSDGQVLPFSDVSCDRIRRFIGPLLLTSDREERNASFGRAVGRVLAHELYHIFANTTRHGRGGVAKAFYTPAELVSDTFRFAEKETRALRGGKLRGLIKSEEEHPTSAVGGGQ